MGSKDGSADPLIWIAGPAPGACWSDRDLELNDVRAGCRLGMVMDGSWIKFANYGLTIVFFIFVVRSFIIPLI